MKSTLKSALSTVGLVAALAGFSSSASAYVWTLSPDADALAFGQTVVVGSNQINFLDNGNQSQGIFGAGFTVSGGADLKTFFDADLYTWDSYNATNGYYDAFVVSVSTIGYYWNIATNDPQMSSANTTIWTWGGNSWSDGILENYTTAPLSHDTVALNAGAPATYYVSIALDTKSQPYSDTLHPSWGSFHVEVPEPSMLGLLGVGLLAAGVAGRARRKNVA